MKLMNEHQTTYHCALNGADYNPVWPLRREGRTNQMGVEAVLIDPVMYKRPPVILGPAFGDWLLLQRQISWKEKRRQEEDNKNTRMKT